MPANGLAEGADDEWRGNHPCIYGQVINLERIRASQVFRFIESSHLTGEISLEHAAAGYQAEQGKQKRLLECHQKMSQGHRRRASEHCSALPENAVRQKPAENRR